MLTTAGGLKPCTALALNFVSGWSVVLLHPLTSPYILLHPLTPSYRSVVLGVVIVLAKDVSDLDQGVMLAFGGGVYLQIGATECMSRVHQHASHPKLLFTALLAFACGAIAIGLVLLDHEHCGGDAHAGHGH